MPDQLLGPNREDGNGAHRATFSASARPAARQCDLVIIDLLDRQVIFHEAVVAGVFAEHAHENHRSLNEQKAEIRGKLKRRNAKRVTPVKAHAIPDGDSERAAAIHRLEEDLHTVGEDAQLANVDLQNALQRQQQVLHMMSNVSKALHDTAISVIRKIGG